MSDNPPPQDSTDSASEWRRLLYTVIVMFINFSDPVMAAENRRLKEQITKLEAEVKSEWYLLCVHHQPCDDLHVIRNEKPATIDTKKIITQYE